MKLEQDYIITATAIGKFWGSDRLNTMPKQHITASVAGGTRGAVYKWIEQHNLDYAYSKLVWSELEGGAKAECYDSINRLLFAVAGWLA